MADGPARANVPPLAVLQDQLQRAILEDDDAALAHIPGNGRANAATLLGVYRHAYAARLVEVAANDYPRLVLWLGREAFEALARAYLAAHPSRHPNVRWFADGLPEFISEHAEIGRDPAAVGLARLERALNRAFDCADESPLELASLAAVPPERWGDLVLTPQRSTLRIDTRANVFAIWQALKNGEAPPPAIHLSLPERLVVSRQEGTPRVRVLTEEEAALWDAAMGGAPFGALCELAAHCGETETAAFRAARYLQGWIAAGLLAGARLEVAVPR